MTGMEAEPDLQFACTHQEDTWQDWPGKNCPHAYEQSMDVLLQQQYIDPMTSLLMQGHHKKHLRAAFHSHYDLNSPGSYPKLRRAVRYGTTWDVWPIHVWRCTYGTWIPYVYDQ